MEEKPDFGFPEDPVPRQSQPGRRVQVEPAVAPPAEIGLGAMIGIGFLILMASSAVTGSTNQPGLGALVLVGGFVALFVIRNERKTKYAAYHQQTLTARQVQQKHGSDSSLNAMAANEAAVKTDSRAIAIVEKLCQLDAAFRVSFPKNLGESLSEVLNNIETLRFSRKYPIFTNLVQSVFDLYQGVLRLSQTHVSEFRLIGGGFGIEGAAKGIILAEAVNRWTRRFSNARVDALYRQMTEAVDLAHRQIVPLRQFMLTE